MYGDSFQMVLDAINTLGVIGLLVVLFVMFYRGDILSRKVYQDLTERVLKEVSREIIRNVKESLRSAIREEAARGRRGGAS